MLANMNVPKVDKKIFKFKYLPDYSEFLLKNKLEEFVRDGIRFAREMDLPMLKPLSKVPETELVKMSLESNKLTLKALSENKIGDHIEKNLTNWINNKLGVIDKSEVIAEDLTLTYHLRRKLFSHYLYEYAQSAPIQQLIINEIDVYTSMEELLSLKVYMQIAEEART